MTLQTQNLNVNKWNYGCYSSDNYGANSIAIELGQEQFTILITQW